jgi:hypothetical protein
VERTQLTSEWTKGTFQATLWGQRGHCGAGPTVLFMPRAQRDFAKFQDDRMQQAVVQARTMGDAAIRAHLYKEAQPRPPQNTFVFLVQLQQVRRRLRKGQRCRLQPSGKSVARGARLLVGRITPRRTASGPEECTLPRGLLVAGRGNQRQRDAGRALK